MATTSGFFTPEVVSMIAGSIMAAMVVSISIRRLIGKNTPVIPFAVSLLVTYTVAEQVGALGGMGESDLPLRPTYHFMLSWLVPAFYAILLFIAVIGATSVIGALLIEKGHEIENLSETQRESFSRSILKFFFESWLE